MSLPRHLAIIMDGNGRWAQRRRRPRVIGHRAGARAVNRTIDFCLERGIGALTLFAFSSENWGRPQEEVDALMKLFLHALDREVEELQRRGVRVRFIGDRSRFAPSLCERMAQAEARTRDNQALHLSIAASYGGRQDIALAARALAEDVAAGRLRPEQIDEEALSARMALAELPPPDLFIRTGGDLRISNFLLWQLAYTELWFTETLWPEFGPEVLQQALDDYARRERRFGLTSAQVAEAATENVSA
ncbi:Ditrans,polycis-undecaprenyl-diphosphate synthase ((2E,6E)-farnesyl-diphosphate specific) [Xanthomonas sacchari]|uniref:Ditrans,polycis-undecaprenyl-diphosphate synthase ((2E,6E)-farnesyl-diphosphate specific) n=1 Tax=Xanthomonas sacchari TaxID=56458 RepID=A0AA46QB60_9XANT|nr:MULTISPECIES: polyprenyl diphosphate synthase [Xanthomonas]KAB7776406.1 di-trans,poly-cis-decaprenylcistransferase [Xanthomonas sp. LMG 12460]MCW0368733.1 Ditrans,polycis-undecaprenyl-diphosphate synthase ((2E,6E)-farnesyl-diphosphate specific) [Xanthomonas sacchari]MCW0442779.1 Ditrans,polycis-undecaprenyl-diphosphate synthase ((2E,6E)-farnesyl-diphosphate specific) [Xanthomonas sacchari]UYK87565.1 polyprenyl diphosphate synthase [Xanthomonas sacchari]